MIKKFYKKSPIELYRLDTELDGHIFSLGRIGAGKSVSTKSIIEGYYEKGYKIFDLYGGERHEGMYWAIPSQDKSYWDKLTVLGSFDEEGPKQYKVNFLYPYFEKHLPSKLPQKLPNVNSKLFTIPLKDIEVDDMRLILENMSDTSKYVWDEILEKTSREDDCAALMPIANTIKGAHITPVFKNFILPMSKERFLGSEYCDYNLDIKAEAKQRDTITVLVLKYVPERFHLFIMNYLMRKLSEYIDENKVQKKNILFIREAATFFRATDDSILEARFKYFRTKLANYIRMGRRGMFFALDCQSASEVRGLVSGSEDYMLMYKTTAWRDKAEMTEELKRERRMTQAQIADLAFLDKGECFVAETGKTVHKVKVILPRSDYWKKDYPDFYTSYWARFDGQWKDIKIVKDYIDESYNKIKEKYELIEEEKRLAAEKRKQPSEEEDEDYDNEELEEELSPEEKIEKQIIPPEVTEALPKIQPIQPIQPIIKKRVLLPI